MPEDDAQKPISHTPEEDSIVLGPDPDGDHWTLSFHDGLWADVEIHLPEKQLHEMDAEFTGVVGEKSGGQECPHPTCTERFHTYPDEHAITTLFYHLRKEHPEILRNLKIKLGVDVDG